MSFCYILRQLISTVLGAQTKHIPSLAVLTSVSDKTMSATSAAGLETVTITQLQSSQDLGGPIATDGLNGILQQQQSLVMATPVTSVGLLKHSTWNGG